MKQLHHLWTLLLVLALVWALTGLIYTPHDPGAQDFRERALTGPTAQNWLGVDPLGRDFFSRIWKGTGHTVSMALAAMAGTLCLAALLLTLEQSGGHWIRRSIGSLINLWVAVPVVFIGLLLLVALSPSPGALVLAAILGNVPFGFRQLRVSWQEQRTALYVEASEVLGANRWQIFARTIWPNLVPDLLAIGRLLFAISALELSGLAFLGLIGDPDFPELGAILKQHQSDLYRAPALVLWPGFTLACLLLLVHLSGRMKEEV